MSHSPNRIARVVFEAGLHGRERVAEMQKRISAFAAARLQAVLADSLSLLAANHDLLIFYKVELDLGKISFSRIEEDLEAGIARCLRDWALRAVPLHRQELARPASGPDELGHHDVAAISLSNLLSASRSFPTPALRVPPTLRDGLNAAVASALRGTGDWTQLMAIVRENQAFRSRLASEVSPELLRRLLQSLVPVHGAAMADFAATLITLHRAAPLVSADPHAFRRVVWECVLTEVARYQAASFSPPAFFSRVLDLLAARYSLKYSFLSGKVREGLQRLSRTSALPIPGDILKDLNAVVSPDLDIQHSALALPPASGHASELLEKSASSVRPSHSIADLGFFLEWGVLPSTLDATGHDAESELLKRLVSWPDEVCALVRRLGETQQVRKRIAGQFSESVVHRLIAALDPVNAPWMILFTRQLRRLHAQKPLVALQNRAFAQLLWELALEYLSERHWHALDAVSFLRFLLQRLAARQKAGYEILLADLALRRSPHPQRGPASKETGSQALVSSTIITLVEHDLLGVSDRMPHLPRLVVQPAFRHLYSDLDVLAFWLRWQRLPAWTLARDPEEVARHIGPLLRELPPEVRNVRETTAETSAQSGAAAAASKLFHESPAPEVQIQRWLLYGAWPVGVSLPQSASLVGWLESQDDTAWLHALLRCGTRDLVVHRLVNHLSFAFLLRIAGILAGPGSAAAVGRYLGTLRAVGRHVAGSFLPPWQEQVSRYALIYLLKDTATRSHAAASIEELAHSTLEALSLRCQVSYERLLILLQQEGRGDQILQELCQKLDTRFRRHATIHSAMEIGKPDTVFSESTASVDSAGRSDLVLYYLKHGSLPSRAREISLRALRHSANQITDDQLRSIANYSLASSAQLKEVVQRAATLLSPHALARFKSSVSRTAPILDRTVATPPPDDSRRLQTQSEGSLDFTCKTTASHEPAGTRIQDSAIASGPGGANTGTWSGLDSRPANAAEGDVAFRGRLDAITHLLRTGNLPWWGDTLTSPASNWFTASLRTEPGPLLETIRSVASCPRSIDRLLQYVPQPDLVEIIQRAAPEYGGLLTLYIKVGVALVQDHSLSPNQRSRTPGLHWRETLLFVLDENPPSRIPSEVLRAICRRVAQQLDLAVDRYLHSMIQVISRSPSKGGHAALAQMLAKMQQQAAFSEDKEKTRDLTSTEVEESTSADGFKNRPENPSQSTASLISGAATNAVAPAKPAITNPESSAAGAASVKLPLEPADGNAAVADTAAATRSETSKPGTDGSATVNRGRVRKTEPADSLELPDESTEVGRLEYLLRYGALPQSAVANGLPQFMGDLSQALTAHPEIYRLPLQKAASYDLERKRIARLFSPQALSRIWPLLLPTHHAHAVVCLESLHSAAISCSASATRDALRQSCVEELLRMAAGSQQARWESAVYLRRSIERLAEHHSLRPAEIVERLRQVLLTQPKDIQEKLGTAIDRAERETAAIPIRQPISSSSQQLAPPAARPFPPLQRPSSPLPAGEPFYIGNAGVILLWPFLTRYFQNLGLLEAVVPGKDKTAFRGEFERSRAIYLVQYLATGKLEAPEHELLLNKILCGAQPEQPLEPVSRLAETEEALSTQMLNAVIANWQKLRNTSIEGLRQSFLLREGRLLRRDSDDAWSLTVSIKGYDILLDSLPWRFSTIRLPWMQTVLHVKWR